MPLLHDSCGLERDVCFQLTAFTEPRGAEIVEAIDEAYPSGVNRLCRGLFHPHSSLISTSSSLASETILSELIVSFSVLFRRPSPYRTLMETLQTTKPQGRNEQPISETIVVRIAEAEGVEPRELDTRLYDVIEPDALDELFQHREDGPETDGVVSFTYHGYEVTVHSDSSVEINQIGN